MISSAAPANAARRRAGWYDDEVDASALRYWDGRGWTPHTSPKPVDPAASVPDALEPAFVGGFAGTPADALFTHTVRLVPEHTTVPTPLAGPAASVSVYGAPPTHPRDALSAGQVALLVIAALAAGAVTLSIVSAVAMMLLG